VSQIIADTSRAAEVLDRADAVGEVELISVRKCLG